MSDRRFIPEGLTRENGVFFASRSSKISFPEKGNEQCRQLELDSFWFQHRNRIILSVMRMFPAGEVFYDVGGGNGFVSKALQDTGQEVVLVEPGISGCVNARDAGLKWVLCSSLQDAGFAPGSIPSAGLFDVLEHIEDPQAFLSGLYRLLRPGGRVYLTVPAYNWLWSGEDDYAGHYRRYTQARLLSSLEASGFVPEFSSSFFSILLLPILLFRAIPFRLGIRKRSGVLEVNQREHRHRPGLVQSLLSRIWNVEAKRIAGGKTLFIGSSILAVAMKPL